MNSLPSIFRAIQRPTRSISLHRKTERFVDQEESKLLNCPHCGQRFYSFGGQAGHIAQTACRFMEQAKLSAERVKRSLDMHLALSSDRSQGSKRVRFAQGEITFELEAVHPAQHIPGPPDQLLCDEPPNCEPPIATDHKLPTDCESPTEYDLPTDHELPSERKQPPAQSADQSSQPTQPSAAGPSAQVSPRDRLYTHDGGWTYIEPYPDPLAGSPINDAVAPPVNLHEYVQGTGSLADLENFNTLELLMTTGLTNDGRDRFIKSRAVSKNLKHCEQAMLNFTGC